MIVSRQGGHYNRTMQRDLLDNEAVLQVAAQRLRATQCDSGQHQQETDMETGNEVCGRCGVVLDDYADVAAAGCRFVS